MLHLHVVVRARKDASAVEAALRRYYPDWRWRVDTLRGERRPDWILGMARDLFEGSDALWKVLLLGKRSYPFGRDVKVMGGWTVVNVGKAEVRNARLVEIVDAVEAARAADRLRVAFRGGTFELRSGEPLTDDKDADVLLRWGRFSEALEAVTGASIPAGTYVSLREPGSPPEETLYDARGSPVGVLRTPEEGEPAFERLSDDAKPSSLEDALRANRGSLRDIFEESTTFLREAVEGYDVLVVPVSGGKDSTVCLSMATEVAESSGQDVVAVHVDTGFDLGTETAERLGEELGVDVEIVDVSDDFKRGLSIKGAPSHDDRWCTGVKLAGVKKVVKGLEGKPVLVVGDRDAESRRRRLRPPEHENRLLNVSEVNPIKGWSAAEVLMTCMDKGLPVNPLYELGFYRLGCSICPSLTSWERGLLREFGEGLGLEFLLDDELEDLVG